MALGDEFFVVFCDEQHIIEKLTKVINYILLVYDFLLQLKCIIYVHLQMI